MTTPYNLFAELIRCSFLGGRHTINGTEYSLEPTILRKYDLVRQDPDFGSKSQMNRLFSDLSPDFKNTAKSEMYRKGGKWFDADRKEHRIKQYEMNNEVFLVPILSDRSVGIDTSSHDDDTYVCIAFFDNHTAGYHYLEKFLDIPKSKSDRPEFKWYRLNSRHRENVCDNIEQLIKIACSAVLVIKTNALKKPSERIVDVFTKLVEGLFTDYEHLRERRDAFRNKLFSMANSIPVHCDADFKPLDPLMATRQMVRILSDRRSHDPICGAQVSHESEPIQIADILCGALSRQIMNKKADLLTPWEFHDKLRPKTVEKTAKCYYWMA